MGWLANADENQLGEAATLATVILTRITELSAARVQGKAVIDFLESRGKFVARGDGFSTSQDKICNH